MSQYTLSEIERDELQDILDGQDDSALRRSITESFLAQCKRRAAIMMRPDASLPHLR